MTNWFNIYSIEKVITYENVRNVSFSYSCGNLFIVASK